MERKRSSRFSPLVIARDGSCQDCGSQENLQAHHIEPFSLGGVDAPENGITLCCLCHCKRHLEMGCLNSPISKDREWVRKVVRLDYDDRKKLRHLARVFGSKAQGIRIAIRCLYRDVMEDPYIQLDEEQPQCPPTT